MIRHQQRSTLFPYTTLFRSNQKGFVISVVSLDIKSESISHSDHRIHNFWCLKIGVVGDIVLNLVRSEEHTSELQSRENLVCRLLLEKKNNNKTNNTDVRQPR